MSDAAVHNNGTATCAWVIWAGHDLWSGEGYIPGIADEMYSGLAEAYGIATVLGFVAHYLNMYPLALSHRRSIQIYCNNQGVIDRINNHTVNPYPCDAIKDDYPVYKEIEHQIQQLQLIAPTCHHVKGHQDQKPDTPLTLPELLNIDCDKCAAQVTPPNNNDHLQTNPPIISACPHLCIRGQIIISQLQHRLCDTATYGEYRSYLQQKFQWTGPHVNTIHWKVTPPT